jgi:hypothetical protein
MLTGEGGRKAATHRSPLSLVSILNQLSKTCSSLTFPGSVPSSPFVISFAFFGA